MKAPPGSIEVLVVDDSAVVRQVMTALLSTEPAFRVSTATDPVVAMVKMKRSRPRVILLDMEMPRMDGLTFLKRLMEFDPIPVVVCSGYAGPGTRLALRALEAGAVDIAVKPRVTLGGSVEDSGLMDIVRAAAEARVVAKRSRFHTGTFEISSGDKMLDRRTPSTLPAFRPRADVVVAIGASTGGTEALREVLRGLPPDGPAVVIVQHMPEGFTAAFAEHLDGVCPMQVREAQSGDLVRPGLALVAPGNRHMRVVGQGAHLVVELSSEPPVSRHRPSVDVLFSSVAQSLGPRAIGVIMTGMGADGAEGILEMKRAGATTIAQDEASCVVFGMPKEAIDLGGIDVVLPLSRIPPGILQRVAAMKPKASIRFT
jgi:two-component system chemotaxis response regulator CheB